MSDDLLHDAVEWRPRLSAERQARVDAHRERFSASASVFREIRLALGLSQVEAASRLGMTQANVSKLERRRGVDLEQIKQLVAGSGLAVTIRLEGRGEQVEFAV